MKLILLTAIAMTACAQPFDFRTESERRSDSERKEWVASSLRAMEEIRVGMTRAQLLTVFVTEGGLSSRTSRTYVFKNCPYFKVDVEFEPVGDVHDALHESLADKIKNISPPYLQWSHIN